MSGGFVFGLRNDAFISSLGYVAFSDEMNWEGCGQTRPCSML